MSQEIELKLAITQESIGKLTGLDFLSDVPCDILELENTYFDTPDQVLTSHGAALRIRLINNEFIQTFKSKGNNIGGLHQRDEWEYSIPSAELDLSLIPDGVLPNDNTCLSFSPLFSTNFQRTRWLVDYGHSKIEMVLDLGEVVANNVRDQISELELELKAGNLDDLLNFSLQLSKQIAVTPSDMSKAERGYRLCNNVNDVIVSLPDIVPQQSMESAFIALFGYELELLQRNWQVFWSTQEWRHLQAMLTTLGNMNAELEWFQSILPDAETTFVSEQINWVEMELKPILSWWPACFALSQDAEQNPQSLAISLQQDKAKKAIQKLKLLQKNPEFGFRMLSLTSWLHKQSWRNGQTHKQKRSSEIAVIDGLDHSFGRALDELRVDCFTGSVSNALSQSPAVHRLLTLCQYFDRLYGEDMGSLRAPLLALEENLSRLSAMDILTRLKDWLNHLPFEQQASIHSWTRSQPVLLRDMKMLASKLNQGRESLSGVTD